MPELHGGDLLLQVDRHDLSALHGALGCACQPATHTCSGSPSASLLMPSAVEAAVVTEAW
jgi:hypothetical protein